MLSLGVPGPPPRTGGPGDEGWDWDRDDWDPAGSLTAQEIAALAALDRAGDSEDDRRDDPCDAALDAGAWLAGPGPLGRDDGPCSPLGAGPVEALPGLTPRRWGTGSGFDAGGVTDTLPPGPVLAGLADDKWAAGLRLASDDELAGLMIAWRRVASWAAAGELAAVAELSRRRSAQVAAGADPHLAEHISDEVAMALTLTSWAADALVDRADGLARLPRTMAALTAGEIDIPKALVLLGELSGLGDVHAARVEAAVIGRAAGWTTGELRRAARHQVIAADPAAARRRKERAAEQARVERWAEDAGTAALAGRDLPPAGVLAADAHLTAWAKRLKVAGVDGNLDQLRAQVYLTLLNGQPPETLLPAAPGDCRATATGDCRATATGDCRATATGDCRATATGDCRATATGPCHATVASSPAHGQPPSGAASSPAHGQPPTVASSPAHGQPPSGAASSPTHGQPRGPADPSVRGSVNLVLPLSTWLGWSASPGEVAGFGPLDAADSRALAAALARAPATTWCVTITGADGRAVAHGCAKAGPDQPPKEPPPPPMKPASPQTEPPSPREGGPGPPAPPRGLKAWLAGIGLAWLETGDCSHRRESAGYRPSPSLAHLIQIRQQRCTAPGCRRPAAHCDFEHAIPYHQGGRTCECNGGPCCRRHHRAKQAAGWRVSQPRPGTFVWTTPLGRSYRTDPEPYPT